MVKWSEKSACCVIGASEGYPLSYEKGYEITIPDDIRDKTYIAGAKLDEGKLVTSGGRVLGVTAVADSLEEAVKESYRMIEAVEFKNKYYRTDIGARALAAK